MRAYYVVLLPAPDAKEGTSEINPLYAQMKNRRWVEFRRFATRWRKKEGAEKVAVYVAIRRPEFIGRVEVMFLTVPKGNTALDPLYQNSKELT